MREQDREQGDDVSQARELQRTTGCGGRRPLCKEDLKSCSRPRDQHSAWHTAVDARSLNEGAKEGHAAKPHR